MSMAKRIREYIFSLPEGELFTSTQMTALAPRRVVDQTLHRLSSLGVIVRITRGIFMRETEDGWRPSAGDVAIAKAKAFGKFIVPFQRENKDGQATETFLCTGGSSSFKYGNQQITFKHACPRRIVKMITPPHPMLHSIMLLEPTIATLQPQELNFAPPAESKAKIDSTNLPAQSPENRQLNTNTSSFIEEKEDLSIYKRLRALRDADEFIYEYHSCQQDRLDQAEEELYKSEEEETDEEGEADNADFDDQLAEESDSPFATASPWVSIA